MRTQRQDYRRRRSGRALRRQGTGRSKTATWLAGAGLEPCGWSWHLPMRCATPHLAIDGTAGNNLTRRVTPRVQAVCLALCTVKGWRYLELSVAKDLLPHELMEAIDERVPSSLFVFNLITTVQSAYITVKEPTRESISGCASGNSIAAIFTLVLYLECE